jgi:hypothetical protein
MGKILLSEAIKKALSNNKDSGIISMVFKVMYEAAQLMGKNCIPNAQSSSR